MLKLFVRSGAPIMAGILLLASISAQAFEAPQFLAPDTVIRDDFHYRAIQHCRSLEAHLPTAREWAQFAQSRGAKGVAKSQLDDSYYLIQGTDSDGKPDHFYYSNAGYKWVDDGVGHQAKNFQFWASSVHSYYDNNAYSFSYIDGYIGWKDRDYLTSGVYCVSGR